MSGPTPPSPGVRAGQPAGVPLEGPGAIRRKLRLDSAVPAAEPVGIRNVANALTISRLLLVPVFAIVLTAHGGSRTGWREAACVIFVLASLTDRMDGQLARRRNIVTEFGKIADPIADKALIGTALVGLSILGELSWAVTTIVIVREVGVTGLRFWVIRHGVIPASPGGKLKTLLQSVAIGLYILPLTGWVASARAWVLTAAVVVTLVTGGDYVVRALRLRTTSPRARQKRSQRAERLSGGN